MKSIDYPGVQGRCYLVTGASSGIGRATAILLSKLGAQVILVGRCPQRLQETLDALNGSGHLSVEKDLLCVDNARTWLDELAERMEMPLAGIAHCAGEYSFKPLRTFKPQIFTEVFERFTNGTTKLMHGFSSMSKRDILSSFVCMSSVSTGRVCCGNGLYAAVRSAVENISKYFAVEFSVKKIRFNCIRAGHLHNTGMGDSYYSSIGVQKFSSIEAHYPLGIGDAEDAASAIVFLLGTASKWITGSTVDVDGGYLCSGV